MMIRNFQKMQNIKFPSIKNVAAVKVPARNPDNEKVMEDWTKETTKTYFGGKGCFDDMFSMEFDSLSRRSSKKNIGLNQ